MDCSALSSPQIPYPRKHLGQHYLVSQQILERIIQAAKLGPNDKVVEIGPGTGKLTLLLAKAARQVIALEIDSRLCEYLQHTLKDKNNVEIIQTDAAKYDYRQLAKGYPDYNCPKFKLVANLPYYISTPILTKLIEQKDVFEYMVVMLQAEFARRIEATPGSKAYGALSIVMQYHMDVSYVMDVPASCFRPRPKVDSAVVRLAPLAKPRVAVKDEKLLFALVRAAFAQRRKTIYNALTRSSLNLPPELVKEAMAKSGIDPGVRGETISLAGFAKLTDNISHMLT